MKTFKRSLSLWLAVILTAGLLYVPAFGSDTNADQQEPALTTTEEAAQDESAVEEAEDTAVIEEKAEEPSEDAQEEPASITEDEDVKDDAIGIDNGADAITEEAEAESSEDIEKEESETVLPETKNKDEFAEITEGTTAEETVLPEVNDTEGLPVTNSVEDAGIADAIDLSLGEMQSGTITYDNPNQYYRFVPKESETYILFSKSNFDTVGTLLDSSNSEINENDDGGENTNFSLVAYLEAGTEYYLRVRKYSSPSEGDEYSYSVGVKIQKPLTVTYDANGGWFYNGEDRVNTKEQQVETDQDYSFEKYNFDTPSIDEESSLVFAGWSLEKNGEILEGSYYVDEDITVYAVWKSSVNIILDANGGIFYNGEVTYIEEAEEESYISSHFGTTPYYEDGSMGFAGWSLTKNGSVIDYTNAKEGLTLYAIWKPYYTVTFHDARGKIREEYWEGPESGQVRNATTYTDRYLADSYIWYREYSYILDQSEENIAFVGWSTVNGGEINEDDIWVTGTLDLYAVWKNQYTITFDANGGYFSNGDDGDNRTVIYTESYVEGDTIGRFAGRYPAYDGTPEKVFLGWGTSKSGGLIGNDGLVINNATTLYAQWGEPCGVTFHGNGGGYFWSEDDGEVETITRNYAVGYLINRYSYWVNEYGDNYFAGWSLTKDGAPIGHDGYQIKGGETFYAVWVKPGWNQVGSGWMYLGTNEYDDYYLCENEWLLDSGKWYYFDRDNWMVTGWRYVGGEWYYLKSNGAMAANEWACDSVGWCWMDGSGKITKNKWILSGGQWYYLKANGYMAANEWARDSVGWCWMDGSGKITKNKWILSGGQWYYLKADGYMAANEWAKDSTGWCWMDESGKITKNKWILSGGQWYYLKANGYMAANEWAKDSGGWYWMDGSGKITKNKWIQSGGKWYYLGANGYMVTGTRKIGGKTYKFSSSGVWIR